MSTLSYASGDYRFTCELDDAPATDSVVKVSDPDGNEFGHFYFNHDQLSDFNAMCEEFISESEGPEGT